MNRIGLINCSDNRLSLIGLGIKASHIPHGANYIIYEFDRNAAVGSIFLNETPLLGVDQVAPLLLLPDSVSRSLYLLSTKQITRFNPMLTREVLDEYYASLNTSVL